MIGTLLRGAGVLLFALGTLIAIAGNAGATTYGSVKMQWKTLPTISLVVTPNHQAGYGPQGGAGSGSTPAPGALAALKGGDVDFGSNVVQGYQYLYKYAAQATVMTNDLSGFSVYGEGTTDVNDTSVGGTVPLSQTLFWLTSGASNNPFTPATAFEPTSAPVGCGSTCINYPGNPPASAQIWTYPSETIGQPGNAVSAGYDYQLRLNNVNNPDQFSVYIVYTAVGN